MTESFEPLSGGCACGQVRYKIVDEPLFTYACHCTDCQTLSGSAFRIGVSVEEELFEMTSGEPKKFIKTAESGAKRSQVVCPACGTQIYSTGVEDGPKIYRIRVSTACQRNDLPPKVQIWFRSAQPWVTELDSIQRVHKQS